MSADRLELTSCTVWLAARRVERSGGPLRLSAREAALLRYLVERPERVVGRDELLREVWRYASGAVTRAVDHTVARLRKKIERDPARPVHILSEYGEGYRFVEASPTPRALVGRSAELAQVLDALHRGVRLVSVVGPGGAGKTTLANAVARRLEQTGRAVWRVQGAVDDAEGWEAALRTAGALPPRSDPVHALARQDRALVVVDDPGRGADVASLLDGAPTAQVLASTRRVLGAPGEHLVRLEGLAEDAACALFLARAEAVSPGVSGRTDRATLRTLVSRLDGLPLALELCAARCSLFEPAELVARLDDPVALLDQASGGLRATFAVSWDLLSTEAKRALVRLATFEGPFTVSWAETLLGTAGLTHLQDVRDHSLLSRDPADHRLHLLDTIRAFVRQEAARSGAWGSAVHAHAVLMATLADEAPVSDAVAATERATDPELRAVVGPVALQGLLRTGQTRAAQALARELVHVTHPDSARQAALWGAVARVLDGAGDVDTAVRLLEWVQDHGGPELALDTLPRLVWLLARRGESTQARERAVAGAKEAAHRGAVVSRARLLNTQAVLSEDLEDAFALSEAAVAALRRGGDNAALAHGLSDLGVLSGHRGRADMSLTLFEESLALRRGLHDRQAEATAMGQVGGALEALDRFDEAETWLRGALDRLRVLAVLDAEATVVSNLGLLLTTMGRRSDGRDALEEGLALYQRSGNQIMIAVAEGNLGVWHLEDPSGHLSVARARLEASVEALAHTPVATARGWFGSFLGVALAREGRMEDARIALETSETVLRQSRAHVALAHAWVLRATVLRWDGQHEAALELVGRARDVLQKRHASPMWWRRLRNLERSFVSGGQS